MEVLLGTRFRGEHCRPRLDWPLILNGHVGCLLGWSVDISKVPQHVARLSAHVRHAEHLIVADLAF